ncbi:hypothetical protein JW756_07055 [Candidatus Woesearchaeota archaeon]|nr:hypothetical protein [Candidatus Woesearchaeota archaeon]
MGAEEKDRESSRTVLKPGIIKEINGRRIPTFPDYTDEIKEFLKEQDDRKPSLPFVNQDKAFMQILRTLSTSYPYVAPIGQSGIGKSMMVDYIINLLTGKTKLEELKQAKPEAVPMLEKIIEGWSNKFGHRKFLSIANLADPLNVDSIAYTSPKTLENDFNTALSFCNDISEYLKNYIRYNKDDIRFNMSEEEFRRFVKLRLHTIYLDVLEEIEKNMRLEQKKDSKSLEPIGFLKFHLPDDIYDKKKQIKAMVDIINIINERTNEEEEKTKPEQKEQQKEQQKAEQKEQPLIRHISHTIQEAEDMFKDLLYQASMIDIVYSETEEKKERENVFMNEYNSYINTILKPAYEKCKEGKIRNHKLLIGNLLSKVKSQMPERHISQKTIDKIIEELEDFKDTYIKYAEEEKLKSWMSSVVQYFKEEKEIIKDNLLQMVKFDERENDRIRDEIRERRREKDLKKEIARKTGFSEESKEKKEKEKKEDDEKIKKLQKKYWSEFNVPHGIGKRDIERIMTVRELGYDFPTNRGITWTKLGDLEDECLFGLFSDSDGDEIENEPPHCTIERLGPFFKSGLLVFPDAFKSFIEFITSKYNASKGLKGQFLEYLQTGVLTIFNGGISYRFEAPKIIIGCDNEDPFELTDNIFSIREEEGMRSRIKIVNVPHLADNTKEVRKGSIKVIYDTIKKYNEDMQAKGNPEKELGITEEAANMILQAGLESEILASLKYRNLTSKIEELCAYAVSKNEKKITAQLLKEQIKDDLPPDFFYYVDREQKFGGYFDLPEKQQGHVNGLSVFSDDNGNAAPAEIVKVRSYFKPGIDEEEDTTHFELVDIKSEMTDETTIKGYELAKDFVSSLIHKSFIKGKKFSSGTDWQIKTHFGENWYGGGGPSASVAIALSMLSAVADDPIYKNRFVTGTLDPLMGEVGAIGGTYYKGLIPFRIKELLEKKGEKEQVYFMFPAVNLKDLSRDAIFDPFGLESKVTCIPITTLAQAYHLFTCGPTITEHDWKNAQKLGEQKLEKAIENIYHKFVPQEARKKSQKEMIKPAKVLNQN